MKPAAFQIDFLKKVVSTGGTITARFSLQREALKFVEPTFFLELDQNGVRSLQQFAWSPELEEYLLFEQPTRMSSDDEEAERFAAILMNNLATAAGEHGKDYAQAVFVDLLRDRNDGLGDLLTRAATPRPSRGSGRYHQCRAFLQHSLDGLRNTAILKLKYRDTEADALMIASLRLVLDETFHISARDWLFPGHHSSAG